MNCFNNNQVVKSEVSYRPLPMAFRTWSELNSGATQAPLNIWVSDLSDRGHSIFTEQDLRYFRLFSWAVMSYRASDPEPSRRRQVRIALSQKEEEYVN